MTYFPAPTVQDDLLTELEKRMAKLRVVWFVLVIGCLSFAVLAAMPVLLFIPQFVYVYSAVIVGFFIAGVACLVQFTKVEAAAYLRWRELVHS